MDQVRRAKVDVVVTFRLDRLARSLCHVAQLLAELQAQRVALVCPSQGIDTGNANPQAMLQIWNRLQDVRALSGGCGAGGDGMK